jgi:type IV pilus assembly protein PilW
VLVALTLTLLVMGAALTLAMAGRRLYTSDQGRTDLNQNLRIGLDLVGVDIRQAGERLPADVPAVEIVDGTSGAPDELLLRRNLFDTVLPLCGDLLSGTSSTDVFVADGTSPPPGCAVVADGNADGWPDNIEVFRNHRIANGGEVVAYLYNPVSGNGQSFDFNDESASTYKLKRSGGASWLYDFTVADGSRIYILEQRTYRLSGDLLQFYLDGDSSDLRNLIHRVTDFQAVAHLVDGTSQATFGSGDDWTELESVEVTLTGQVDIGQGRTLDRELSARFLPRNVLSF